MIREWNTTEIIAQGIGYIGLVMCILSFQFKKHKTVLLFRTLSEPFFAAQYLLMGAYTGCAACLLGVVRNLVFTRVVEKGRSTLPWQILFGAVYTLAGILTWEGPLSLFVITAKLISTVAYGISDTMIVRIMSLPASFCWMAYNIICFATAGILTEIISEISIVVGFIRLDVPRIKAARAEKKAALSEERRPRE